MKSIFIDYYIDGFNVDEINCYDMTMACASGAYYKENYYFYAFLYVIYTHWLWDNKNITMEILNLLGLNEIECHIHTKEELLDKIYHAIDFNNPVLLLIKYNKIFFNSLYKTDSDMNHLLLITGYDKERGLIVVRDYLFAKSFAKAVLLNNADVFIDFKIKTEHLIEMWSETKNDGVNTFYVLEKKGTPQIADYKSLIEYYLNNVTVNRQHYERYNYAEKGDYKEVRKGYQGISMLSRIIRRAFDPERCILKITERENLEKQLQLSLRERDVIVSRIIKELMREGRIGDHSIDDIVKNDKDIFETIQRVFEQTEFIETTENIKMDNIALNAEVLCDSEGKNSPAKNAVNGKMDGDLDCWRSSKECEKHWLIVDLKSKKKSSKFVVRHHPRKKKYITREFRIEGSNNLSDWDVLAMIINNDRHVNTMVIDAVEYRYYRLKILKANAVNENAARIFSFEIY